MGRRLLARSIFASVTIAAAMAGCGDAPQRPSAGTARGTVEVTPGGVAGSSEIQPGRWRRLPDPPFSPRQGATTAMLPGRLVVVGGDASPPCPPGADCSEPERPMSDGAALELPRRAWVPLPAAPHPIPPYAAKAVLGYSLYVIAGAQMLEYDAGLDAWRTHPAPAEHSRLVAVERSVVAIGPSDEAGAAVDEMYDPATRSWHRLPDDPLGPSFGRTAVGTPSGLVLFAHDLVPDPGVTPSFVRAAVLDLGSRRWRKLPTSDQLGGGAWTWTGKRLVDATVGGADGGEVNGYGRMIPYGGTLDPRTGAWGRLPDAPDEPARNGWAATAIDGPAIAAGGWLYDDFAETWRVLPRPDGAPAQAGDAAWAGGSLVVLGGLTYTDSPLTRDPRAWIFPMPD